MRWNVTVIPSSGLSLGVLIIGMVTRTMMMVMMMVMVMVMVAVLIKLVNKIP